jgi:hypothetical protein
VLRLLAAGADSSHDCTGDKDELSVAAPDIQQRCSGYSLTVTLPVALTLNRSSIVERAPSLENSRSAPSSHHPRFYT